MFCTNFKQEFGKETKFRKPNRRKEKSPWYRSAHSPVHVVESPWPSRSKQQWEVTRGPTACPTGLAGILFIFFNHFAKLYDRFEIYQM
jgi:hypothetical protein